MLKGKNAVVTGSTSGIGQAIATMLAEQGCNVMLNGFGDKDKIESFRKELADRNKVKVNYSPADMSRPPEIEAMINETARVFGGIDILVNDAGIQYTAPVEKFPPEKWDAIIAVNLASSFHTVRHTLPLMRRQKYGRIINIISVHGLVASVEKIAYVSAKHGLAGLTKAVALEAANDNITCNGICPGWVLTPLVQKQIEDRSRKENKSEKEVKSELLQKQAVKAFVKPEDIAGFVVFLCGPHSNSITGATLTIDGGWTAQ